MDGEAVLEYGSAHLPRAFRSIGPRPLRGGSGGVVVSKYCIFALVVLALGCRCLDAQISFASGTLHDLGAVGGNGTSGMLAMADLNGDGRPDAVIGINSGVMVILNNGDGTFGTPLIYGVSGIPNVVIADMNKDGHPDIVAAGGGSQFYVLINRGDGTFLTAVPYGPYNGFYSVAVGDFNGDGWPDVAVRSGAECCVISIFLNNQNGTLSPSNVSLNTPELGALVQFIAADLNNDGFADIVAWTPEFPPSGWEVFLNQRNGTFSTPTPYSYPFALTPDQLVAADVNSDGNLDIVWVTGFIDGIGQTFVVALGNGDGTLAPYKNYYNGGISMSALTVADFDGDGRPDLAGSDGDSIAVVRNNGSGFDPAVVIPIDGIEPNGLAMASADINGEGPIDIIMLGRGSFSGTVPAGDTFLITSLNTTPQTGPPVTFVAMLPNQGGNAGTVSSVEITGTGFPANVTVELIGPGTTIQATNVVVSATGTLIAASFNLVGATPGSYSLVLTASNGTVLLSEPGAFNVQQGGSAQISFDIVGPTELRAGRGETYYIIADNQGNIDSGPILVSIGFSSTFTWQDSLQFPLFYGPGAGTGQTDLEAGFASVPAGGFLTYPISLNIADTPEYAHASFVLQALNGEFIATASPSSNSIRIGYRSNSTSTNVTGLDPNTDLSLDSILAQEGYPFLEYSCSNCASQYLNELNQHTTSLELYNAWQDGNLSLYVSKARMFTAVAGSLGAAVYVAYITPTLAALIPATEPTAAAAEKTADLLVGTILDTLRSIAQGVILGGENNWSNIKTTLENNISTLNANFVVIAEQSTNAELLELIANMQTKLGVVSAGIDAANAVIDDYFDAELERDNAFAAFTTSLVPYQQAQQQYEACVVLSCGAQPAPLPPPTGVGPPGSSLPIETITSGDPNDKSGSLGAGPQQYISPATPLRYTIDFTNESTASAPAQSVVITDPLDLAHESLSTFSIGGIALPNQLVAPPSGPADYSTTLDLRPANDLLLSIKTHLDLGTGLMTLTFQSLDPTTNQPPTNPLAGFLPPGMGCSVFFTVSPKQGLATGTQIQNQATIVFDLNPPINTPNWLNTLDGTPPASKVSALTAVQLSSSFLVQWSGTDVGAGVQSYTIYASDNGGSFAPWLANTTATQATYSGVAGHTYSFYSLAEDLVGNIEAAKSVAEATTRVSTASLVPATQISTTASGLAYSRVTRTFNGTVTVKNIGGAAIGGPLEILFTGLTAGVTLANATNNINGISYLTIPGLTSLEPGQSAAASVEFENPENVKINFTPAIYSGSF